MNLGIEGRTALVCGSSRGLGRACAEALAAEGCNVVLNGRDRSRLEVVADAIRRKYGVEVHLIASDLETVEGAECLIAEAGAPDILVTSSGGPEPRDYKTLDRQICLQAIEQIMIVPLRLVQRLVDPMRRRGFGRVVNITSLAVLTPVAGLEISTAARAGLTGLMAGIARAVAPDGVTINNLLPFKFATDRIETTLGFAAGRKGISVEEERSRQMHDIPCGRFGDPAEFGKLCAFLCSQHAGYITGQNIRLDGGYHRAVF